METATWVAGTTRLPLFGDYEDAIAAEEPFLFHSVLTPMLNIGLLTPGDVVDAALGAPGIPLNALEGFIRQVIGWREYVWCKYWSEGKEYLGRNALEARRPLPPAFTGAPTEMACLGHVLADVDAIDGEVDQWWRLALAEATDLDDDAHGLEAARSPHGRGDASP